MQAHVNRLYSSVFKKKEMIEKYIEHYISGDIEPHKESQRKWVKDLGPVFESNMGWIE